MSATCLAKHILRWLVPLDSIVLTISVSVCEHLELSAVAPLLPLSLPLSLKIVFFHTQLSIRTLEKLHHLLRSAVFKSISVRDVAYCGLSVEVGTHPFRFAAMSPNAGRVLYLCRVHTNAWVGRTQLTPQKHGQRGSCGSTPKSPGHVDDSSPEPDR